MINKITIINFWKGKECYDTQKVALINYLRSKFSNISIDIIGLNTKDIIGLNTKFLFEVGNHKKCKFIKLPNRTLPIFFLSILFNLTSFIHMFLTPKPGILYIYSGVKSYPYIGALFCAKLFRVPIFMCIRNPPESLCSFGDLSVFKKTIVKILDALFLKYCTKIIHISEKSKELFKPYPKLYQKSIVMGSCPNNIFLDSDQREIIVNNGLTFVYWGLMDEMRELDIVIKGFAKAKELNDKFDAKFYLFGGGKDLERLNELVKELKTTDIVFKGYVGQEDLCKFLQEMLIAVIPIPPKEIYQFSSPLKLSEAVTMGLPMIASNIEPNQIVKAHNLGILCEHNVDSYAQAFLKFACFSDSELNEFRENCKRVKYLFTPENVFREVGDAIAYYLSGEKYEGCG